MSIISGGPRRIGGPERSPGPTSFGSTAPDRKSSTAPGRSLHRTSLMTPYRVRHFRGRSGTLAQTSGLVPSVVRRWSASSYERLEQPIRIEDGANPAAHDPPGSRIDSVNVRP